ncbi:MFS transporter [soil metagenome]
MSEPYRDKWWVMLTVSMGVLLATIDGSIVNVALPGLVRELDTTFSVIQWVSLGYLLTLATLTLGVGRLGDVMGKKRIYTAGFAAFTIASVLCGLAPSVEFLIAFRVVQALGAVMILALGPAVLLEAFPPTQRGRALGMIGTAVSVGVVTGPVVGGILISSFDWRAIFFVNIPVGIAGTLLALRFVPATFPGTRQRFDYAGAAVMSTGLLAASLALTMGQEAGYSSPAIVGLFAVVVVAAVWFVRIELESEHPMIQLRIFRSTLLTISVVTGFLQFVALAGTFFLLPFYLEQIQGRPIAQVGLLMGAAPLVLGVVSPLSGSWSDRIGVRPLTLAGLTVTALAYLGFLTLDVDTTALHFTILALPLGAGIGLFQSPNNSAIMGSMPVEYAGVGGGLLTLTRLMGQISGIAILGSLWATRVTAAGGPGDAAAATAAQQMRGLHDVIVVMVVLVTVAAAGGAFALYRERRSHLRAEASAAGLG